MCCTFGQTKKPPCSGEIPWHQLYPYTMNKQLTVYV